MEIRRALPSDAEALSALAYAAKSYWGYPEYWMQMWKPQLTFSPEHLEEHEGWVALVENAPVGFCILMEKNGNAWIEDLWVLPDYIGKGVGKALFCHARDLALQRGYSRLQLEADPHAIGFYEKMGMRKIGERRADLDGQPRALPLMELLLK